MHQGGMTESSRHPDEFPAAFESAFAHLSGEVEEACARSAPWAERVAEGIHRVLAFAAAEPDAANLLTNGALARGAYGVAHYHRLLAHFGDLLRPGRALAERGAEPPELLERALAGGVASLIANRVDTGRADELPQILPEAIQFVLTPYLGAEEARRMAAVAEGRAA
jgi:hypothetical protein